MHTHTHSVLSCPVSVHCPLDHVALLLEGASSAAAAAMESPPVDI